MDIPCFAMSVITDLGVPGKIKKVTHEEIQAVSEVAEPKLTLIIKELIASI
jgi:purine-nucleoside phosphorylase